MQIESIKVRRFKSLYETFTPLPDFALLTGPNGSGKSNLAAVIDFLGETYRFGLDYAVGRAGGIDAIAYRRTRRTTVPVSIEVLFRLDYSDIQASSLTRRLRQFIADPGRSLWLEHRFDIKPSRDLDNSSFAVSAEYVYVFSGVKTDRELIFAFESVGTGTAKEITLDYDAPEFFDESDGLTRTYIRRLSREDLRADVDDGLDSTDLALNGPSFSVPPFREIRQLLSRLRVYTLNPASCRNPGVLTPTAALEKDGGNLPGVLARIRRRGSRSRTWDRIFGSMSEIFPNLVDIDTAESASAGISLRFHEDGVGRPWSAHEVSDGTILYLAMLCVLFDQSGPALVVEEPENTLHSWLLRLLLDKCREDSTRQVLLTTHSPIALKAVSPHEVLLASKKSGRTRIRPLVEVDPSSIKLYEESGIDVFEQYDSGFFPETIPGGGVA